MGHDNNFYYKVHSSMKPIKISLITAVYNNRRFIETALKSITQQSYPNIEHIIIDGGSNDGTLEFLEKNLGHQSKLISEKDKGIYDALNKGINLATGDVIGFLHSDDILASSETISLIAKEFTQNEIEATYGDLVYVAQNDTNKILRYWKSGPYNIQKLKYGWMPPHPTFYMKKNCYEEMKGFQLKYKIAADYDACLRYLWNHQIKCSYIPQILVKMRTGGTSNRSLKNILIKSKEDYQIICENKVGGISTLMMKNMSKVKQFFI